LAEVKGGEDDGPPERGEVVLVGTTDFAKEAVKAEAPQETGDLRTGLVLEDFAQTPAG
jgi:hypothetical protein